MKTEPNKELEFTVFDKGVSITSEEAHAKTCKRIFNDFIFNVNLAERELNNGATNTPALCEAMGNMNGIIDTLRNISYMYDGSFSSLYAECIDHWGDINKRLSDNCFDEVLRRGEALRRTDNLKE
jgi:hypothetical protein